MDALPATPVVLLHHDGELMDIRQLLEDLGASYVEQLGSAPHRDADQCSVIIANPHRIMQFQVPARGSRPTLIAVVEGDSRTLRAHLRRISVDLVIRRPVHPAALRLLILHTLYRGPERRNRQRVSIGGAVRFRSGWLPRGATLIDLSLRGCRLLCRSSVEKKNNIKLSIPSRIACGRSLQLQGTVLRIGPTLNEEPGVDVMAVRFTDVTPKLRKRLEEIVEAYSSGPAVLPKMPGRPAAAASAGRASVPPPSQPEHHEAEPPESGARSDESQQLERKDRRATARRSYSKRVVALGDQATRVLLGCDISLGGMRVDPNPDLTVGDKLQIALHASMRAEPLVINAKVRRDDGENGLVLSFDNLSELDSKRLAELVDDLPVIAVDWGREDESGVVISEILDRRAG